MDWVESKSIWCFRPEFAEIFVGSEAFECLESSGEVVGSEEVVQVRFESVMGVVEVSLGCGVYDAVLDKICRMNSTPYRRSQITINPVRRFLSIALAVGPVWPVPELRLGPSWLEANCHSYQIISIVSC